MMSPRFTFSIRQQILAHGTGRRIGQFVHQQVVADQQRILHRSSRDDEGLYQRRGAEQQQENGDRPLGDGAAR